MFIRRLTIKNYKSIRDLTLRFDDNETLLFGNSGVGKTSVFEVIYKLKRYFTTSGPEYKSNYVFSEKDITVGETTQSFIVTVSESQDSEVTYLISLDFVSANGSMVESGCLCLRNGVKSNFAEASKLLSKIVVLPFELDRIVSKGMSEIEYQNTFDTTYTDIIKEVFVFANSICTVNGKIFVSGENGYRLEYDNFSECEKYIVYCMIADAYCKYTGSSLLLDDFGNNVTLDLLQYLHWFLFDDDESRQTIFSSRIAYYIDNFGPHGIYLYYNDEDVISCKTSHIAEELPISELVTRNWL